MLTEELLRRVSGLDDLNNTGAERFNTWDVVGEDTHVTRRGGDIDLDYICGREESLETVTAVLSVRAAKR